jgi:putative ABC transport system permease protein
MMESLAQDLWFTLRSLRKRPGLSLLAIFTLALGIGANVAIFSTVYGVLLRPLPYPHPEQLAIVWAQWLAQKNPHVSHTGGDFREYQRQARSFAGLGAVGYVRQILTGGDQPVQVQIGYASQNFFRVLGVRPSLGRDFGDREPASSLILGNDFWRRHFAGDPAVLGRTVRLDGQPFTVVGVLPAGFRLYLPADIGISAEFDVWKPPDEVKGKARWVTSELNLSTLRVIGRLKPGVTLAQAQAEMDGIARQLRARYKDHAEVGYNLSVQPLQHEVVGHVEKALLALQGAVALVLLIACLNVANLLLVRAYGRQREIAMRLSLGGEPRRVTRQMLMEALVLALAGAALGVLLAHWEIRLLVALKPARFPRLDSVAINGPVLAFALLAALLSALLAGLAPALRIRRWNLSSVLREQSAQARGGNTRLNRALIVVEVALSMVLLLGAGLLMRSFSRLQEIRPGFDPRHLLTFSIGLPGSRYQGPDGSDQFVQRLQGRISSLPGVVAVGMVWPLPLEGQIWYGPYRVEGQPKQGAIQLLADYRLMTPTYPQAMGARLLEGRTFTPAEKNVVVIDKALADRHWPGRSALGRTIYATPDSAEQPFQVVGVIESIRHRDLRSDGKETFYLPSKGWSWVDWELSLVVRTATDPRRLVAPIREELRRLDPQIPMAKVRLMEDYMGDAQAANRFALIMMGVFSLVALLLAAVGLYGVVSYSLGRRTREIGIRMALGAQRARIFLGATREGMLPALAGVAFGLAGSFALTRVISGLLFGVGATDPLTCLTTAGLLMLVTLAACCFPARRAVLLDPTTAIREE